MTARGPERPVIGVVAHTAPVKFAVFDMPASFVTQNVVDRIAAAGGLPVLLPSLPGIEAYVDRLDGVVLPGGPDLDPARYASEPHPRTTAINEGRDTADLAVAAAAVEAELPILGLCRGLQVLNVLRHGTLHQHIPEVVGHDRHLPGRNVFGPQRVQLRPGSHVAEVFEDDMITVPCYHHQAVDRLGTGLAATGWADDGLIEAVEIPDLPFAVAVQWHAEESEDMRLFLALTRAARRTATRVGR